MQIFSGLENYNALKEFASEEIFDEAYRKKVITACKKTQYPKPIESNTNSIINTIHKSELY